MSAPRDDAHPAAEGLGGLSLEEDEHDGQPDAQRRRTTTTNDTNQQTTPQQRTLTPQFFPDCIGLCAQSEEGQTFLGINLCMLQNLQKLR